MKNINLKGKSFLKLLDFSAEEITYLLDLAADLKAKKKAGIAHNSLCGKNIALIFEKTSTRTRCSFETAAADLKPLWTFAETERSSRKRKNTARIIKPKPPKEKR